MVYIITDKSVSVFIDGQQRTITSSHPAFTEMKEAIKNDDEAKVKELFDVKKRVESFGNGKVEYKDGVVYYKGEAINNYLTRKIVQLQREGFTIEPLLKFLENLQENPYYRAREELYQFLEYGELPITEDGYFVAYKKVRSDFKDIYTGTFDNSVGAICEMPRRDVDDNSERTCSAGLHFASREYMKSYGSSTGNKVVALKINPADVVAIPKDYNNTKGRCTKYEVIEVLGTTDGFSKLEGKAVHGEKSKVKKAKAKSSVNPYEESAQYDGVTWDKHAKRFKAQRPTKPKKGSRHIGYYDTAEDAYGAYLANT